jgi:hypothetical protein
MAGTYTFGTGWTPSDEYGDVTINFATAQVFSGYDETVAAENIYTEGIYYQDITLDKATSSTAAQSLFLLPQEISTVWSPSSTNNLTYADANHLPYVEFHGVIYSLNDPAETATPFDYTAAQLIEDGEAEDKFSFHLYDEDEVNDALATTFYIPIKAITLDANKKYNLRLSIKDAVIAAGTTAIPLASIGGGGNG